MTYTSMLSECTKCGVCCEAGTCLYMDDPDEAPCRHLLAPSEVGERLCAVFDEARLFGGACMAPGCCLQNAHPLQQAETGLTKQEVADGQRTLF